MASALSKMTRTWVEVSSIDTSVSIQRRLTTSTIANAARLARGKCVTSQHQILLGSHLSQSGHSTPRRRVSWGRFGQHEPVRLPECAAAWRQRPTRGAHMSLGARACGGCGPRAPTAR